MAEDYWIEKAQTAEARYNTLKESVDRVREDAQTIMETFAARKKGDGSFDIDFEKFVNNIGKESAMELIGIIYEQYVDEPIHVVK